jgi:cytochrome c oxidase assembly factor CtaG
MSLAMISGLALATASYAGGVRRLARRQIDWSLARSVAFAGGLAVIARAIASPVAQFDYDIRVHMLQHLLTQPLRLPFGLLRSARSARSRTLRAQTVELGDRQRVSFASLDPGDRLA